MEFIQPILFIVLNMLHQNTQRRHNLSNGNITKTSDPWLHPWTTRGSPLWCRAQWIIWLCLRLDVVFDYNDESDDATVPLNWQANSKWFYAPFVCTKRTLLAKVLPLRGVSTLLSLISPLFSCDHAQLLTGRLRKSNTIFLLDCCSLLLKSNIHILEGYTSWA